MVKFNISIRIHTHLLIVSATLVQLHLDWFRNIFLLNKKFDWLNPKYNAGDQLFSDPLISFLKA